MMNGNGGGEGGEGSGEGEGGGNTGGEGGEGSEGEMMAPPNRDTGAGGEWVRSGAVVLQEELPLAPVHARARYLLALRDSDAESVIYSEAPGTVVPGCRPPARARLGAIAPLVYRSRLRPLLAKRCDRRVTQRGRPRLDFVDAVPAGGNSEIPAADDHEAITKRERQMFEGRRG